MAQYRLRNWQLENPGRVTL